MVTIDNLKFEVYIPEDEIKQKVAEVAARINKDYADRKPIMIAVLNGVFIFAADLVRNLTIEHQIHFAKVASYSGTESTGTVEELIGLSVPLAGRDVIVVEDIVDTGNTMYHVLERLKDRGAKSVEICTLLSKPGRRQVDLNIKYCAMEVPDKFILGYGLDYNGQGRNLRDIYAAV